MIKLKTDLFYYFVQNVNRGIDGFHSNAKQEALPKAGYKQES